MTGGAGFIGSNLIRSLLALGHEVLCLDNFDPFYPRARKEQNIAPFLNHPGFRLFEGDINDEDLLRSLPEIGVIVHLAARAGVRPSIENPVEYQQVNVNGTQVLLEFARSRNIRHFVFASSSSVYGVNPHVPWNESEQLLPISPYASTKLSGEMLGHVYSHLYGIRFIALRFFTVYGPGQRPDLAIHKFFSAIGEGRPLPVYGDGSTSRDYTFVGDSVRGILAAIDYDGSLFEVINVGNNKTVVLNDLIAAIEETIGKKAVIDRKPEQPGDVPHTFADIGKARRLLAYVPSEPLSEGLKKFYSWFRETQ
ncbi:MAG TPA: NAD-dependent epimerase/dehydratase family protein [Sphingobacteriaceae bacterium]